MSTEKNAAPPQKSVIVAYFLWLVGGLVGLHHLYLHRDRHAFVWFCTCGGYFGIGWITEIWRIPQYVKDANEDPEFIKAFVMQLQTNKRPPYSSRRFIGEILVGYMAGQLTQMAIPQDIFGGIDWTFLHWIIPFAIALGVWTVGNIGRERGVLHHCLAAALLVYPIRYIIYDETYTLLATSLASSFIFDTYSKEWLRTPPKRRSAIKRVLTYSGGVVLFLGLLGSFLYFNGTISDSDGGEIPVHEALHNFLASAWWRDLKQTIYDTYVYGQHHGWYETWKEVFESLDVDGERNSYKVLGVSATASQAEITAAYRKLSKEFHPDKAKNEIERASHSARFIEIQQAYTVLSKIKSSRMRKNRKSTEEIVL